MNSFEAGNWWWSGKRQLISKTLDRLVKNRTSILDIGCGTGSNLKSWEGHGEVVGLDISSQALEFCRLKGNERLLKGTAAMLPLSSDCFEVVIALDVLEHMEDDAQTVKELLRVCRRGGYLLLTVPALMFLWSQHDVALHHYRRYARRQIEDLLQSGGFRVEQLSFWNCSLLPPAALYRVLSNLRKPREARSNDLGLPGPLNAILKMVLTIENGLIVHGLRLPKGVTLFAVARKVQP